MIKVNMTALEEVEDDIEMTNQPPEGEEVEEDDIEMTEMTKLQQLFSRYLSILLKEEEKELQSISSF